MQHERGIFVENAFRTPDGSFIGSGRLPRWLELVMNRKSADQKIRPSDGRIVHARSDPEESGLSAVELYASDGTVPVSARRWIFQRPVDCGIAWRREAADLLHLGCHASLEVPGVLGELRNRGGVRSLRKASIPGLSKRKVGDSMRSFGVRLR